jgi:hypothetical protein
LFGVRIFSARDFWAVEHLQGDFSSLNIIIKASYLQLHIIIKKAENQGQKRTTRTTNSLPKANGSMESFCLAANHQVS